MEDVLFIAGTLGFFGLGLAYVRLCDRIIGPDSIDAPTDAPTDRSAEHPAGERELAEVAG